MKSGVSCEIVAAGKSAETINQAVMQILSPRTRGIPYHSVHKKRLAVRFRISRTVNRHRWVGRED